MKKTRYSFLVSLLAGRTFFGIVWIGAVLQASWVALVSRYPMAFDEAYHYNLIKLHAQQINPLFLEQPAGPAPYGALVRDPSWLHHYILSFPYRLLEFFEVGEYGKIVVLRLCNVVLFALGLLLFRKLLLLTKASKAAVHAALLFFVLLPTVPLLAGQINYDNLQFPLFALLLLVTWFAAQSIQRRKTHVGWILGSLTVALVGSLNKFTFLPFLLASVLYLTWVTFRTYHFKFSQFWQTIKRSWLSLSQWQKYMSIGSLVVCSSLFVWFYGVNTVVYHNPVVQCHQVIESNRCEGFEPWRRNNTLAKQQRTVSPSPVKFSVDWIGGMFYRTMFTINGATGPKRYTNAVPIGAAGVTIFLIIAGVVFTARFFRLIIQHDQLLQWCLFACFVYIAALWGRNYNDFLHLKEMVAINGRYLHPVLLPIILLVIASYQWQFRAAPMAKFTIFCIAAMGFLSGGGIIGFIHYSNADWFFQSKTWIVPINAWLQKLTAPLFLFR